jgi:hypothetical protein
MPKGKGKCNVGLTLQRPHHERAFETPSRIVGECPTGHSIASVLAEQKDSPLQDVLLLVLSGKFRMDFFRTAERRDGYAKMKEECEEIDKMLRTWAESHLQTCPFCHRFCRFVGYERSPEDTVRLVWECIACTWNYDRVILAKAPPPEADEQCIDLTLASLLDLLDAPKQKLSSLAGPRLPTRMLGCMHRGFRQPDLPVVLASLDQSIFLSAGRTTIMNWPSAFWISA